MKDFIAQFERKSGLTYLNSGTHSLCPKPVRAAIAKYQDEYELDPTTGLVEVYGRFWQTQKELAGFFGARAEDIFLRANVTDVMNDLLLGMPVAPGGEILLSDAEYPAIVNLCRFKAQRQGLTIRIFPMPEGGDVVAAIASQLSAKTKLLMLSHVFTGNGLILPLTELAAITRKRGVLLAIDGAHAPGALALNFSKLQNVDLYGGNLHKWMMGPKGTAFGWVAPRHQERLKPLGAGWTTFETPAWISAFGGGSRFQGRMLIRGCQNWAVFLALSDTVRFWRAHGPDSIRKRIYELNDGLRARIGAKFPWPCVSPAPGPMRGPLLAYSLPKALDNDPAALRRKIFNDHGLQTNVMHHHGRGVLRLSPHAYNTEADLDHGAAVLKKLAAQFPYS